MKHRDPIIDDLHKLRETIGRAHDFDVHRIAASIRRHEEQGRKAIVREASRPAPRQKKAS
jgi:hypothetical protein